MTDRETDAPRDRRLIEKEAVAWFTRMNGKPSRAEKRDFRSWLERSPHHRQAYDEVRALWLDLGAAAEAIGREGRDDLAEPLRRIENLRRESRTRSAGTIVAGCLAAIVAGTWLWLDHPHLLQDLRADYVTARGERRTVVLADGSTVLMDADTALDEAVSAGERRVRLLRGTAFFTVRPSEVPFVVAAAKGEARVLGTTFDVALRERENVTVTLSSGTVEVSLDGQPQKVLLKPGESVDYDGSGLGAAKAVDMEESMAWHQGRFIFTNARLADVLAQIGRYRDGRIVIVGSALGEKRVSGNISLENTDAALEAMRASVGFRLTGIGGKVTLVAP